MIDEMVLQNFVAYAAISFAGIWVARRMYRTVRAATNPGGSFKATSCAGCSQNSTSATAPKVKPLVQIGGKQDRIEIELDQKSKN